MAQYFTDFGNDTIGQPPVGWTTRWGSLGLEVVADAEASNGKSLKWGPGSASVSNAAVSWDIINDDPLRADFEILVKCKAEAQHSTGFNQVASGGRMSGATASANGYFAGGRATNYAQAVIFSVSAGTRTLLASSNPGRNLNNFAQSRFRVIGDQLKYKQWAEGAEEPAEWDVELTNTTHSVAGWVGIAKSLLTNNTYYDFIGVGTGGDTAPSGPVSGLTIPTLIAPANNEINVALRPIFTWS